MISTFNYFLFDLDGTLIDSAQDLTSALNDLMAELEKPNVSYDVIRQIASTGTPGMFKHALGLTTQDSMYEPLRLRFMELYQQRMFEETKPYPMIAELLTYIENSGKHWGIITNKIMSLSEALIKHFNWQDRLCCLIGGDSTKHRKPHPEQLLLACKQLSTTPAQCVYIGDAPTDIQAAKSAGMTSIAAGYGYIADHDSPNAWGASYVINSPEELYQQLQS